MEIPYRQLSTDVLEAVIEEFITREGTDYGDQEFTLNDKLEQIKVQLSNGEIFISYDPVSESCQLQPASAREELNL